MADDTKPPVDDEVVPPAEPDDEHPDDTRLSDPPPPPPQTEDEKRIAKERKLADEAGAQRRRAQKAEKEAADAAIALKKSQDELAELKAKQTSPGAAAEDEAEKVTLQRALSDMQRQMKEMRDQKDAAEEKSRMSRIKSSVSQLIAGDEFVAQGALLKLLVPEMEIAADDEVVFNAIDEDGEKIKVAATVANLKKYKPIPDFDAFVRTKGSPGAGSGRGGNGKVPGDGIDRKRIADNDVAYIQANMPKIEKLRAEGKL